MSDLIDREQALSAFDTYDNKLNNRGSEKAASVGQYLKRVMYKIENLPSAQLGTNLAEVGTDCISRQAAIDAISTWDKFGVDERCRVVRWRDGLEPYVKLRDVITAIVNTPSAQPYTIHSDGRLWVTVDDIDKVNAVVVDERKSKFCKQFYMDAQPEIIRCKDCKHWIPYDWMFSEVWQSKNIADYPEDEIGCNLCDMAMKANDFCSRGERREVKT